MFLLIHLCKYIQTGDKFKYLTDKTLCTPSIQTGKKNIFKNYVVTYSPNDEETGDPMHFHPIKRVKSSIHFEETRDPHAFSSN